MRYQVLVQFPIQEIINNENPPPSNTLQTTITTMERMMAEGSIEKQENTLQYLSLLKLADDDPSSRLTDSSASASDIRLKQVKNVLKAVPIPMFPQIAGGGEKQRRLRGFLLENVFKVGGVSLLLFAPCLFRKKRCVSRNKSPRKT